MRMSCNGCRVLRKGCSDDCSIRPCLDWIKPPDSQANATVFLAKFYGRAGFMNLINAAIFRSLLYEACGRIVNPVYGSVGLMWTGSWQLCKNAVEAVLRGAPITQTVAGDAAAENENGQPLKAYDIRHVNKEDNTSGSNDLHRVRTRCRFKRSGAKSNRSRVCVGSAEKVNGSPSHESSLSHQSKAIEVEREIRENESLSSAQTAEGAEPGLDSAREADRRADDGQIELDLTLRFEPFKGFVKPKVLVVEGGVGSAEDDAGLCKMELGLDYPAL
ncbi:hypothetical protein BUALT_Bualt04G0081100 [Buddleja alternifolia]|uniref:LOB domain-containing protein n=1 Tax=Buddleja alternifolia TaxID=168488 RepID=A0AAV6XY36_9LAMI|nr:hypothetical protein BUALT_Bualt04G0081100 [Buddleja alternifolia]